MCIWSDTAEVQGYEIYYVNVLCDCRSCWMPSSSRCRTIRRTPSTRWRSPTPRAPRCRTRSWTSSKPPLERASWYTDCILTLTGAGFPHEWAGPPSWPVCLFCSRLHAWITSGWTAWRRDAPSRAAAVRASSWQMYASHVWHTAEHYTALAQGYSHRRKRLLTFQWQSK